MTTEIEDLIDEFQLPNQKLYPGINPMSQRRRDITGQKFGHLTATRYSHTTDGDAYWEFVCDCGTTTIKRAAAVKFGSIGSCGCSRRLTSERWRQRFTKLMETASDTDLQWARLTLTTRRQR